MKEPNYYEILEIKENASLEVIKAAYKALAKKYHPDTRNVNNRDSQKSMVDINEAYEILSDENKRKEYDLIRKSQKAENFKQNESKESVYETSNKECYQRYTNQNGETNTNTYNKIYEEIYDEMFEDSQAENSSFFGKVLRGIGREISNTIQKNNREIENAYLEGLSLDDFTLIKRFKYSKGYTRAGYIKALEQKNLLKRDYDGKLIPSYRFKQLFK